MKRVKGHEKKGGKERRKRKEEEEEDVVRIEISMMIDERGVGIANCKVFFCFFPEESMIPDLLVILTKVDIALVQE